MSAETSVSSNRRPLVTQDACLRLAEIHHRFDGENHSLAQPGAMPTAAKVRHLRFFMKSRSNSVPDELPHHAETSRLYVLLHRGSDVSNRVADSYLLNSSIQGSFGHLQQLLQFRVKTTPNRHRNRSVSVIALEHGAAID